jgi:hypothetical protein
VSHCPTSLPWPDLAAAALGEPIAPGAGVVVQLQTISSTRYVSPYGLAQIYAALNDKEQAFKWLQIAYDDRAVWMSYLAVDPVFDGLRSDQRFQDLLRRVRLLP